MSTLTIKVNTDSLRQTHDELEQDLRRIEKAILDISAAMTKMNNEWSGDAHDAFVSQTAEDITSLKDLCKKMRKISNYEERSEKAYNKCEEQVTQLVTAIRI